MSKQLRTVAFESCLAERLLQLTMAINSDRLTRQIFNIPELLKILSDAADEAMRSTDVVAVTVLKDILKEAILQFQGQTGRQNLLAQQTWSLLDL